MPCSPGPSWSVPDPNHLESQIPVASFPGSSSSFSGRGHDHQRHVHLLAADPTVDSDLADPLLARDPVPDRVVVPHHERVVSHPLGKARVWVGEPEPPGRNHRRAFDDGGGGAQPLADALLEVRVMRPPHIAVRRPRLSAQGNRQPLRKGGGRIPRRGATRGGYRRSRGPRSPRAARRYRRAPRAGGRRARRSPRGGAGSAGSTRRTCATACRASASRHRRRRAAGGHCARCR